MKGSLQTLIVSVSGVIKGSEQVLKTKNGYLGREQYVKESKNAPSNKRHAIYDLFEAYQKIRRETCGWDVADRCVQMVLVTFAG